ncbi:MAG: DUF1015 domain-containing protein, partial [Lentisphaerae bacterium]|nr:DUF1015 domain-containing protein [Lentisphaerota bacterium]
MRIKAFSALRPPPDLASAVASVPYDAVDAAALADHSAHSFLRVVRPDLELPGGTDIRSDIAYETSARNFERFIEEGTLFRDPVPCLYLYRLTREGRSQHGVVACCHVQDYEDGLIKRHEHTRPDKEDDRTRLIETLDANSGMVFLAYRDRSSIAAAIAAAEAGDPLVAFTAADGVEHTVWRVSDADALVEAFAAVPATYVADGHHRAAAAVRVAQRRRDADPGHSGTEEYNWFLAAMFPASELKIYPYHRFVVDLNGLSVEELLAATSERFSVRAVEAPGEPARSRVDMYVDGRWYELSWDAKGAGGTSDGLAAAVLQERLLGPVLGIGDPRTDTRIDFVGGAKGPTVLAGLVGEGKAAAAFAMPAVGMEQVMA